MTTASFPLPDTGRVMVASANTSLRQQISKSFHENRCSVQEAVGGADALVKLENGDWQVLFLDRRLPDLDAEELIAIIKRRFPGIEVVVLDSDSGEPLPAGLCAGTQVSKHHNGDVVSGKMRLQTEGEGSAFEPLPGMVGTAPAMRRIYRFARMVAPRKTTVLITGPTGTGKEVLARAIHQLSPRANRPMVVVNCAAIPETLLESELFGHARGAYTGAVQASSGRVLSAQGGTLFLDEIGELPLSAQAKLLRFLDRKEVQRLGSSEVAEADVRVVAATNADLARLVREGKFRRDLYYRLIAFPLELPPLAERMADLLSLAEHFLGLLAQGESELTLSPEAVAILRSHRWEGNVRELQQVMERASILAGEENTIGPEHIYFSAACPREGEQLGQSSTL